MRLLFLYSNVYSLGGIQTWLLRVLPRLGREGHEVALLTRPRGKSWDTTTAIVDRLSEDVSVHVGPDPWFKAPRSLSPAPPRADVLFVCNVDALLLAALVQRHLMPEARLVAGVFHPREYCVRLPLAGRRWSQHLAERLLRELPSENFVCCTPGMAEKTGRCLGRDLTGAPVLPIPIDTERHRSSPRSRPEPGKVVSVARLTAQYPHHHQMIGVIRELRTAGHEFTYHAYGEGGDRAQLEDEARRLGVADAVFFHGTVPYAHFADVVADAFAFIGIGTSLIEAAACRVPALVAIAGHPGPMTYGFIQDAGGHEIGGYVPGHPQYPIAERLLWLKSRSEPEYAQLEEAARSEAEQFSVTSLLPRFVDILSGAAPCSARITSADRLLGRLDWLVEAVLLNLGAPDLWGERHMRDGPGDVQPMNSA